ncbi:MAG TPA: demethoxyubiquinone hydroxylase family protein [Caulobacteraceae bacterium]|nr:demethoxyubiquinone hydroxylase family protein [Caulobacteraceae bacterium]
MTEPRPIPPRPGPLAGRARIHEMLRVDHAGELAAGAIYRGQRAVLAAARGAGRTLAQIADLEAQENEHLARFDALILERRVRPSLLAPLWRAAGFGLGAATALIGQSAAHACTEAVETVIEGHYAAQIAELEGAEPALAAELARFRDDELAHRDIARAEGARGAPFYPLLAAAIRAGCRAAIRIAEKA